MGRLSGRRGWVVAGVVVLVAGGAVGCTDDDPEGVGATSTSTTTTAVVACPSPAPGDPRVDRYAVTVRPAGFEPAGEVEETSTGFVDLGGETTATLRLVDGDGRTIEVVSFGAESPHQFLARAHQEARPEVVEVRRCLSPGAPAVTWRAEVSSSGGRTVVGSQEWEYGGFLVVGSAGVARASLLAVVGGLQPD